MPGKTGRRLSVKASKDDDRLMTVVEFMARNRMGISVFYRELGLGRLEAIKLGGKTLISREAERAWRASLPRYTPWPEAQPEARA
jgi:hypothetical protein